MPDLSILAVQAGGVPTATFDYIIVGLLGGFVGLGELVARYRDAPRRALTTFPAFSYIAINVVAAVAALALTAVFDLDFGATGAQARWLRGLVAGVGAMAFFRSSIFTIRVGDQDIGVGPSSFLQVLLEASDRGVDRLRAGTRAREVERVMTAVSYAKAETALPTLCLALMQNLAPDEQVALGSDLKELRDADFDERIKSLVLGLKLMNVVGPDVLFEAVQSLGVQIAAATRIELPDAISLRPREVRAIIARVYGAPPARDDDAADIELGPAGVRWTSADEQVARIDQWGRLVAVAPGKTVLSASLDGITRPAAVVVESAGAEDSATAVAPVDLLRHLESERRDIDADAE